MLLPKPLFLPVEIAQPVLYNSAITVVVLVVVKHWLQDCWCSYHPNVVGLLKENKDSQKELQSIECSLALTFKAISVITHSENSGQS